MCYNTNSGAKPLEQQMAYSGYKGFIDRLVIGKEKSESYARNTLPSNRWELFWDIIKNRLGRLMLVNLLVLLFFIPVFLLIGFRYLMLVNYGSMYPFSLGFGTGYMAGASFAGLPETIAYNTNLVVYLLTPIVFAIAGVGISGGAYVIRNMVWTEGVFVANDFWKGVRQNIKSVLMIMLIFSFVFYASVLLISLCDTKTAAAANASWVFYLLKALAIVLLVFVSIVTLYAISLTVTYEMNIFQLFRNAFIITVAMPIRAVFFAALSLFPFAFLFLGEFFAAIGTILILLISFSWFFLLWTDYTQWIFDRYINDRVAGAQKNRGIYQKNKKEQADDKDNQAASLKKYKEQLELLKLSSLSNKPIKPITDEEITLAELPESFTRKDIEKLNQSRKEMYEDHERYVAEHMSDDKFKDMYADQKNGQKDERQKRMERARKELAKRDKKR